MQPNFNEPTSSLAKCTEIKLHPVTTLELYFEQEIKKIYLDNSVSKNEARDLGRNLGRKISDLTNPLFDVDVSDELLLVAAKLIWTNINDKSLQSACWGNLRKGFVGDSNSYIIGTLRAALLDNTECSLKELQEMFFRYPQLKTEDDRAKFEEIKKIVTSKHPNLETNEIQEASLLLYNMSILRKGIAAFSNNPTTPYVKVIENLMIVCKDYLEANPSKNLTDILRVLSRVTAIYDKASYRILTGRKAQDEFKKLKFIGSTKHDFLRRIRSTTQLAAILTRGVQNAATSLVARGSYLGRLYLDTLIEFPQHATSLHNDSKQTAYSLNAKYKQMVEDSGSADFHSLKQFVSTQYINIGLGCLNQEPGTDTYCQNASNDVAQLSEFIFQKVFELEFNKLADQVGKPSSKVAFIVGGANARREYPSFDYDWYCAYEQDGQLPPNPNSGIKTYKDFFTKLAQNMSSRLVLLGASSDVGFAPHDPISHETHWASTIESYKKLLDKAPDSHLELRLRQSGMFIAGDANFGSLWLSSINELVQEKSEFILKARARSLKAMSEKSTKDIDINIKSDPGGLRQGTILWSTCSTAFNQDFKSMSALISFLKQQECLSPLESKEFLHSYKFLLALRVRLDMQYGRNDKCLPSNGELVALAKSVGYEHLKGRSGADELLIQDVQNHMSNISRITLLVLERLRDKLLKERGYDIFDDSMIKPLEEATVLARAEYKHIQMMRIEESGWGLTM